MPPEDDPGDARHLDARVFSRKSPERSVPFTILPFSRSKTRSRDIRENSMSPRTPIPSRRFEKSTTSAGLRTSHRKEAETREEDLGGAERDEGVREKQGGRVSWLPPTRSLCRSLPSCVRASEAGK